MAKKVIVDNTMPPTNYIWCKTGVNGELIGVFEFINGKWTERSSSCNNHKTIIADGSLKYLSELREVIDDGSWINTEICDYDADRKWTIHSRIENWKESDNGNIYVEGIDLLPKNSIDALFKIDEKVYKQNGYHIKASHNRNYIAFQDNYTTLFADNGNDDEILIISPNRHQYIGVLEHYKITDIIENTSEEPLPENFDSPVVVLQKEDLEPFIGYYQEPS